MYHDELWRQAHGLGDGECFALDYLFGLMQACIDRHPEVDIAAPACANPLVAALRSARRVGWNIAGPTELSTARGEHFDLMRGTPAALRRLYRAAWNDKILSKAVVRLGQHGRADAALGGFDQADWPRLVLRRGGKLALSAREKNVFVQALAGQLPTASLWSSRTGRSDVRCTLCGTANDTAEHRLSGWCPALADQEA